MSYHLAVPLTALNAKGTSAIFQPNLFTLPSSASNSPRQFPAYTRSMNLNERLVKVFDRPAVEHRVRMKDFRRWLESRSPQARQQLLASTSLHCGQFLYFFDNKSQILRPVFTLAVLEQALGILEGCECGTIIVPVLVYFG